MERRCSLTTAVFFCLLVSLTVDSSHEFAGHETLRGLLRPAMAELLGSALFVFVACGFASSAGSAWTTGAATIGIAFSFGMSIFILAYSIGHISGGHLNFAVTLTFAVLRKISILKCILYFFAQFCGGLIGIGFLKAVTPKSWDTVRDSSSRTAAAAAAAAM